MGDYSSGGVRPLLRQPAFVGALLLYGCLQLATRVLHWPLPTWVTSWLADLLCLPVVLTLALAAQRYLCQQPFFTLPPSWMWAAWLATSLWFEWAAPYWYPGRYTADWFDVVAYGLGTLFFARWMNRAY